MGDDKKPDVSSSHITLKVISQDQNQVFFRIKRNMPLKTLMDAYCTRLNVDSGTFKFLFDGDRFNGEMTPDQLKMDDGDEIDAFLDQLGGAVDSFESLK